MSRIQPFNLLLATVAILASFGSLTAGEIDVDPTIPEIRTREIYVPYTEFLKVSGANKDATLMTLAEYRALIAMATAKGADVPPPALPAVRANLAEVTYTAKANETTVRFDGTFKLSIIGDDWVRCDLGPQLPGWGSVTLDKQPGWAVIENGRVYLIAKGAGGHTGTFAFTVRLQQNDDDVRLETPLPPSSAATLSLEVPGRVTALRTPETAPVRSEQLGDAATRVTLPIGHDGALDLHWKSRHISEKNPPLLFAQQEMGVRLSASSPAFQWTARVNVERAKVEELVFTEQSGANIIALRGPAVAGWRRDGKSIRVTLVRPTIGEITFTAEGVIPMENESVSITTPTLVGAQRDTRFVAVHAPPGRIARVSAVGARDTLPLAAMTMSMGLPVRRFLLETPDAIVTARASGMETAFDTWTTAAVHVDEKRAFMRAVISVQVERGQMYSASLIVPPPWTLLSIQERGGSHGLRYEKEAATTGERWTLTTRDAMSANPPTVLTLLLTLPDNGPLAGQWESATIAALPPTIEKARTASARIGVRAAPSLDLRVESTAPVVAASQVLLDRVGLRSWSLRAGLWAPTSGGSAALTLTRRRPRGESHAVTHVMASEQEVWVRCDLRLAIVDRAIDSLDVILPPGAKEPFHLFGAGAREISAPLPEDPTRRRVLFDAPWLGLRTLRIEYRAPLARDADAAIPDIRVAGDFQERRQVVFQSSDAVELTLAPSASLEAAAVEELPAFAAPFDRGRIVSAHTIQGGAAGTFRVHVHERSPVLSRFIETLELSTVLDASGVSRTRATFDLIHPRLQSVPVKLPEGAKLVALTVADEAVRPIKGSAENTIAVPLPPRTTVRIELLYERAAGALGSWGSWREAAPEIQDVPVGRTVWMMYSPHDYAIEPHGGNLWPAEGGDDGYFALSFFRPLGEGRLPRWTAWERISTSAYRIDSRRTAKRERVETRGAGGALTAIETTDDDATGDSTLSGLSVPEGVRWRAVKLGGAAEWSMGYRHGTWHRFVARTLFVLAALLGVVLWRRRGLRAAALFAMCGLVLGTIIPPALGWRSSMLVVPFCEGLSLVVLGVIAVALGGAVRRTFGRWRARRITRAAAAAVVVFCAALPSWLNAAEGDEVLIPIQPTSVTAPDANPEQQKVYVPKPLFQRLMEKAYPEKKPPSPAVPFAENADAVAWGDAEYRLRIVEAVGEARPGFVIDGTLHFRTFRPKGWARVTMDWGNATSQPAAIRLDGEPVALAARPDGPPYIQVFGEGAHVLTVELRGTLEVTPGRTTLRTQLIGGVATRLFATLPAGVEVDAKALPAGAWLSGPDGAGVHEIHLGASGPFQLSWRTPDLRPQGASQISSRSHTHFQMDVDGYRVRRLDRITIDGPPLDAWSFRVLGDWEIDAVAGNGVAEWNVTGAAGERRLRVWFQKPIGGVILAISGWAPLKDSSTAAGMALEQAVIQEGFISLQHGSTRRFTPDSLTGLARAALGEWGGQLAMPAGATSDRVHRFREPPESARVGAEWVPDGARLDTRAMALIQPRGLVIAVRTRYTIQDRAPLRHEVPLPPSWEVRSVRVANLRSWEILSGADGRRLVIEFFSPLTSETEITWSATAPLDVPATGDLNVPIPQPRAALSGTSTERIEWIVAADRSLVLSSDPSTTAASQPLSHAQPWVNVDDVGEYRLGYLVTRPNQSLSVNARRLLPIGDARVASFISVTEDHALIHTRIRIAFGLAAREKFSIVLPAGAKLLRLDAADLGVATRENAGTIDLAFHSPLTGEQSIDLTYRIAPDATGALTVAGVRFNEREVARTRHAIVLLPSAPKAFSVVAKNGLFEPFDAETLPDLPLGLFGPKLGAAYNASADWSLTLRRPDAKVETGPEAEIALARIRTIVADDGRVRSIATYSVRNRARQFLRVALPPEAALWGVRVDGRSAAVGRERSGGREVILVPVRRQGPADLPMEIVILYEDARAALPSVLRSLSPIAPEVLDTPVIETYWQVCVPEEYSVNRSGGNVREVAGSVMLGGKLKKAVGEGERLLKIAEKAETPAQRRQALRSLSRLQQELSDDVAELETNGGAKDEETKRIERDELDSQLRATRQTQEQAETLEGRLKALRPEITAAVAGEPAEEQRAAVIERYVFLAMRWRRGERSAAPAAPKREPWPGEVGIETVMNPYPVDATSSSDLPPLYSVPEAAALQPIPTGQGLQEKSALLGTDGVGADWEIPASGTCYTFRRIEGHPELTLSLRSRDASWRLAAQVAAALLVLGAAAFAWRIRR